MPPERREIRGRLLRPAHGPDQPDGARREVNTLAWVEVSDNCMSFTVGVAKSLQAVVRFLLHQTLDDWDGGSDAR